MLPSCHQWCHWRCAVVSCRWASRTCRHGSRSRLHHRLRHTNTLHNGRRRNRSPGYCMARQCRLDTESRKRPLPIHVYTGRRHLARNFRCHCRGSAHHLCTRCCMRCQRTRDCTHKLRCRYRYRYRRTERHELPGTEYCTKARAIGGRSRKSPRLCIRRARGMRLSPGSRCDPGSQRCSLKFSTKLDRSKSHRPCTLHGPNKDFRRHLRIRFRTPCPDSPRGMCKTPRRQMECTYLCRCKFRCLSLCCTWPSTASLPARPSHRHKRSFLRRGQRPQSLHRRRDIRHGRYRHWQHRHRRWRSSLRPPGSRLGTGKPLCPRLRTGPSQLAVPSIRACGANRNQRGSMRIDVTPQAPAITAAAPDHCRCSHARAATLPGDGAVALLFANDVFGGGAQLRWRRGTQRQQQRPHCNRTTRPHAPEPDGIVWPRDRARINGGDSETRAVASEKAAQEKASSCSWKSRDQALGGKESAQHGALQPVRPHE